MNISTPSAFSFLVAGENSQSWRVPVGDSTQTTVAISNYGPGNAWFLLGAAFGLSASTSDTQIPVGTTVTTSLSGSLIVALVSDSVAMCAISVGTTTESEKRKAA